MSNFIDEYNKLANSMVNNCDIYNLDKNCYINESTSDRLLYITKEEKQIYEGTKTMCCDIEYSDSTIEGKEFIGRFIPKNVKGHISFELIDDKLIIFEVVSNNIVGAHAVYNTIDHVMMAYSIIDTLRLLSNHYKVSDIKDPNKLLIRTDSEKRRRMR